MQTIIYDGSFGGWLCAVFDVYEYKWSDVDICTQQHFKGNVFEKVHVSDPHQQHSERVWNGLQKKVSKECLKQLYHAFLAEIPGVENTLLEYVRYVFSNTNRVEKDFSHPAILMVTQTAKKVWREKHRMEAFVRFQKTKDGIYFSLIEPDYNVLPLLVKHFSDRYADQQWMIFDACRKYGIYYDLHQVQQVSVLFSEATEQGKKIVSIYDPSEEMYQLLWQQYFKSVNIAARKNMKLHIQHMPKRYWKHLIEKIPST